MKRKIEVFLQSWKISSNKKPLIIRGARQIGKTFAVRQFAKTYRSFIEINLIDNTEFKTIFENGYSTEKIIQNISFRNPAFKFIPGDTLIFFDEMQEMPDCATSLKFFAEDGRFDIICSSSMMGAKL